MRYVFALDTDDGELARYEHVIDGENEPCVYVANGLDDAEAKAAAARRITGRTVWIQKLATVAVYQGRKL